MKKMFPVKTEARRMIRLVHLLLIVAILVSFLVDSCQKNISGNGSEGPQRAQIFLTDHQTPIFDSVFIDIQKLEVKLEDDSLSNGGWVTQAINPGVYNILRFRNGLDTLFATGTLPNGNLSKLRLTLGANNRVMKNGQSAPLGIHDNDRQVEANLDNSNFVITGGQVFFWIDFDAARSIQVDNSGPGDNNGFLLKPHIKIFTKSKSGRIEGRVLPRSADALVMAIIGADTTMAVPDDDDGEFKIVGLNAGVYKVFIDGQNGFQGTTINNVQVIMGEDTHLPTITLHQ
jgi:hypothetical protein